MTCFSILSLCDFSWRFSTRLYLRKKIQAVLKTRFFHSNKIIQRSSKLAFLINSYFKRSSKLAISFKHNHAVLKTRFVWHFRRSSKLALLFKTIFERSSKLASLFKQNTLAVLKTRTLFETSIGPRNLPLHKIETALPVLFSRCQYTLTLAFTCLHLGLARCMVSILNIFLMFDGTYWLRNRWFPCFFFLFGSFPHNNYELACQDRQMCSLHFTRKSPIARDTVRDCTSRLTSLTVWLLMAETQGRCSSVRENSYMFVCIA